MSALFGTKAKIAAARRIADADQRAGRLMAMGLQFLEANRLKQAYECFDEGYQATLDSRSGEPAIRYVAAYCAAHAAHCSGLRFEFLVAKKWAEISLSQDENYAKAYEMLGKAEFGLGNVAAAHEHFLRSLRLNAAADETDPGIPQGISFFIGQLRDDPGVFAFAGVDEMVDAIERELKDPTAEASKQESEGEPLGMTGDETASQEAAQSASVLNLHEAIDSGDIDQLRELLHKGADANATDHRGWTALFFAVYQRNADAARSLLEAGADPNVSTAGGIMPLDEALRDGDAGLVQLLSSHGAEARS